MAENGTVQIPRRILDNWLAMLVAGVLSAAGFVGGATKVDARLEQITSRLDEKFKSLETTLGGVKEDVAVFKSQNTADRLAKIEREVERLKALSDDRRKKD